MVHDNVQRSDTYLNPPPMLTLLNLCMIPLGALLSSPSSPIPIDSALVFPGLISTALLNDAPAARVGDLIPIPPFGLAVAERLERRRRLVLGVAHCEYALGA